jgi:hypothetical protein
LVAPDADAFVDAEARVGGEGKWLIIRPKAISARVMREAYCLLEFAASGRFGVATKV